MYTFFFCAQFLLSNRISVSIHTTMLKILVLYSFILVRSREQSQYQFKIFTHIILRLVIKPCPFFIDNSSQWKGSSFIQYSCMLFFILGLSLYWKLEWNLLEIIKWQHIFNFVYCFRCLCANWLCEVTNSIASLTMDLQKRQWDLLPIVDTFIKSGTKLFGIYPAFHFLGMLNSIKFLSEIQRVSYIIFFLICFQFTLLTRMSNWRQLNAPPN